jgi:hypothetical protein
VLWQHPIRNRNIVRLARSLADPDRTCRAAVCPNEAGALEGIPTPSVLVLVENVKHGLVLARTLSGPPLADPWVWPAGLSNAERAWLRKSETHRGTTPHLAVVTVAAFGHLALAGVDVVVRADGGIGLPPLSTEALLQPADLPVRDLLPGIPWNTSLSRFRART